MRLDEAYQPRWHDERTSGRRVGPETKFFVAEESRVFVDGILQIIDVRCDSVGRVILDDVVDAKDDYNIDRYLMEILIFKYQYFQEIDLYAQETCQECLETCHRVQRL